MANNIENRYMDALQDEEREREDIRREGREFDATESARRRAEAISTDISRRRRRDREKLLGSQVRAGRIDSGFGYEDQDRLEGYYDRALASEIAKASLEAERMNLRNLEGRRRGNRYLDMLTGEREREEAEERSLWETGGSLLGTGLGLAF